MTPYTSLTLLWTRCSPRLRCRREAAGLLAPPLMRPTLELELALALLLLLMLRLQSRSRRSQLAPHRAHAFSAPCSKAGVVLMRASPGTVTRRRQLLEPSLI